MPTKQYVNVEGGDPAKGDGRGVPLEISVTETKPGSATGQTVYVFIEPDGGNEDATHVSAADRASNFHTKTPYCNSTTLLGTKTKKMIAVGSVGGDKFKFKVSKKDDGSGAVNASGDGVEVWRKVFVQVTHMKDCPTVDPTSLNGRLAKVFIVIENRGGVREFAREGNTQSPSAVLMHFDPVTDNSKITARVAFIDRIIKPGEVQWDMELTPGGMTSDRKAKLQVKDDKMTWPFDDWLLSGKIYLFDGAGQRMAEDPITNYLSRMKVTRKAGSTGRSYQHKEGLSTNRLLLDLSKFPNIERWASERGAKAKVFLDVRIIKGCANGQATSSAPNITIATRSGWNYKPRDAGDMAKTLLHEFGHAFGHVLRYVPRYKADDGTPDDHDDYAFWYEGHGGVGNHCHNGSTLTADKCDAGPNACVMYHAGSGSGPDFCGDCQLILKRAPLFKLGRQNVWANGW